MTFVNWPFSDDLGYRDSGEGGLFAYAAWPTFEDAECHIDAMPQIPLADVLVAAHGSLDEDFKLQARDYHRRDNSGEEVSYEEMMFDLQIALGAVVFLGSTSASLYSERNGEYFSVTADSLTEKGKAMIDALTAAYGVEPTFLTYLDT